MSEEVEIERENSDDVPQVVAVEVQGLNQLSNIPSHIPQYSFSSLIFDGEEDYIDAGTYAEVYRAELNGELVAVKIFKGADAVDPLNTFVREIWALDLLRAHPNILSILGYCMDGSLGIITKYCDYPYPDLVQAFDVDESGEFSPIIRKKIAVQVCSALARIHEVGLVHGDVRSKNVFLTVDLNAKLGDFGSVVNDPAALRPALAHDVGRSLTLFRRASLPYTAPEVLDTQTLTPATDMYSFGILLNEIAAMMSPYEDRPAQMLGAGPFGVMIRAARQDGGQPPLRPTIAAHASPQLRAIIERCWHSDPDQRLTAREAENALWTVDFPPSH